VILAALLKSPGNVEGYALIFRLLNEVSCTWRELEYQRNAEGYKLVCLC
jgi:hypothetical protein